MVILLLVIHTYILYISSFLYSIPIYYICIFLPISSSIPIYYIYPFTSYPLTIIYLLLYPLWYQASISIYWYPFSILWIRHPSGIRYLPDIYLLVLLYPSLCLLQSRGGLLQDGGLLLKQKNNNSMYIPSFKGKSV